jgi:hypothetical protein
MPQPENNVLNECLVALSQAGCLAWRNDTGAYKTAQGRLIRYGLCKGSADIIAIAPDGVFVAVECKTATGRASTDQLRFLDAIKAKGGRSGVARSGHDAVRIALGYHVPR